MDKKEQILHYYRVDGLSLREISRRVGLNRKTVTRYVREYEDSIKVDPEEGLDMCLGSKPKYPSRNVERTRLTDPVCAEIGLGIKACLQGYTVFFTSVPHLLTLIREAKTEKTLRNLEIKFERYDLVICDELGYVGFDKEGAEMLFNHLSLRTGKKATIITTNLPFTRWEEVLKDKVLCSALVDRLCHKSYLVNMTGTSYRIKETKKIIDKSNV